MDQALESIASPDSDVWSFDLGTAETIDDGPDHDRARQNTRRHISQSSRGREKYSSPPPDYRSSIRDRPRKPDIAVGHVPSHYNVSALYSSNPTATASLPRPIEPETNAPSELTAPPLVRDASVKTKPGFQRILKGWDEHHLTKRSLASRLLRKSPTIRRDSAPVPSVRNSDLKEESNGPEPSPAYELSAESASSTRGPHVKTASVTSSPPVEIDRAQTSEIVAIKRVITDVSRASGNTLDSPVSAESTSPEQRGAESSTTAQARTPATSPASADPRRGTSQKSQRTILEDVPEHESEELLHRLPLAPREPSVMEAALEYYLSAISASLNGVAGSLNTLQKWLPIERPIPTDHVRVRWRCRCGVRLHDDFIEVIPGAAAKLEAELNRPTPTKPPRFHKRMHSAHGQSRGQTSLPSRSGSSGGSSIFSAASSQSSATSAGDIGDMSLSPSPNNSRSGRHGKPSFTANGNESPHLVRLGTESEVPWLLTCCAETRLTPKLTHISMDPSAVRSDRDVALAMKSHYNMVHSGPSAFIRLRGLKSIDFIKFEVHRNRFADIRAKPHMPPFPHPSAISGYNPDRPETVSWEQATDYAFEPGHLIPPVGPHYLMHLFNHPHDYDTETITLQRIPKKLGGRLEFGIGWGVELVEGFMPSRVWAMLCMLMLVASATFISVWMTRGDKGDVQGAFAVAAWVVACVGVLGGWIGALVE